ncbi:MFS transporter [Schaedlerella arabinosiphila]|uniref:MFS transporter n=1 Tax=Schaedlerella arabinosiphila TaxID=2044587 RepID=UPI002557CF0D|nr:MFS transporter [Schaedlerella arabinosiphila]
MKEENVKTQVQGEKAGKGFTFFYATSVNGTPMLIASIITSYYALFLTDELMISAGAASLIMLIATVWDAINDPLMGVIADRTHTRFGRYRPYFLFSPVLLTLFATLMWAKPNFSTNGLFVWGLIMYISYGMTVTMYTMPRYSILPAHVKSQEARNRVVMFSTAIVSIVYSIGSTFKVQMVAFFTDTLGFENGYIPLMIVCGIFACVCFWGLFATSKERYIVESKKRPAFLEIGSVLKHCELYPFIAVWFLASISYGMMFSTSVYYIMYYIARPDLISLYMGIVSVGTMVSMIVLMPLCLKIFKTGQKVLAFTQIVSIILYVILFIFGGKNLLVLYVLTFIATSFSGMQNGLVDIFVNDAVDFIQLKDGASANGVISSIKGFSQKCGNTVTKAGILFALGIAGYVANAVGNQPESAMFMINFLRFGIPVVAAAIMLVCIRFNPIEKYADEIAEMKKNMETKA